MWKWLREKCKKLPCILGSILGNCIEQLRDVGRSPLHWLLWKKMKNYYSVSATSISTQPYRKRSRKNRNEYEENLWKWKFKRREGSWKRSPPSSHSSHPPTWASSLLPSSFLPPLFLQRFAKNKTKQKGWRMVNILSPKTTQNSNFPLDETATLPEQCRNFSLLWKPPKQLISFSTCHLKQQLFSRCKRSN